MAARMVRFPLGVLILGLGLLLLYTSIQLLTYRGVQSHPATNAVIQQVQPAQPTAQATAVTAAPAAKPASQPAPAQTQTAAPTSRPPIASTAPPSADAADGGGHIASIGPGGNSGICTATKNCK